MLSLIHILWAGAAAGAVALIRYCGPWLVSLFAIEDQWEYWNKVMIILTVYVSILLCGFSLVRRYKACLLYTSEHSEVVLACQERLKELGYLTTTPDGAFGQDTIVAVKQFQARNDLVVDGYLGPSTRMLLESGDARPNGMMLGEEGDAITRVQELLSKYGYLSSANVTGYYGEITENAVRNFQSRNGLTADGLVGVQTMAKLTGDDVRRAAAGSSGGTSSGGGQSSSSGPVSYTHLRQNAADGLST